VFLDETGAHLGLTRLYARSRRGQRAHGKIKRNRGGTLTTIAAVTLAGVQAAFALPGGTDGPAFLVFVRRVLVPSLRPGQTVVLDNLGAHKVEGVRQAIEGAGCSLLYLPPYSPELNPIEECWSKVKAYLQKVGARTTEALERAIADGLALVTPKDLKGWFAHAGYRVESA
jgi:transposase